MRLLASMAVIAALWNCVAAETTTVAPRVAAVEISSKALLLHLPLTNDFQDLSPQHHEVDTEGTVEVRDGVARLGGQGSWIETPHLELNGHPFAIAMWVKPSGHQKSYGLVEQRAANVSNQHLHAMLRGSLQPYFGFLGRDVISPVAIPTNQWTHLVFQFDGSRQQIWVNGDLLCERSATAYADTAGLTRIGRSPHWNNVPAHDFEGELREVRIYGRSLSFDEIGRLSYSSNTRPQSLPRGSVPLLSLSGSTLTVRGAIGEVYEVEATTNLDGAWQKLATVTNITGRVQCLDPDATRPGDRYYRVIIR